MTPDSPTASPLRRRLLKTVAASALPLAPARAAHDARLLVEAGA
jgi:hypothetical protein